VEKGTQQREQNDQMEGLAATAPSGFPGRGPPKPGRVTGWYDGGAGVEGAGNDRRQQMDGEWAREQFPPPKGRVEYRWNKERIFRWLAVRLRVRFAQEQSNSRVGGGREFGARQKQGRNKAETGQRQVKGAGARRRHIRVWRGGDVMEWRLGSRKAGEGGGRRGKAGEGGGRRRRETGKAVSR